MTLPLGALRLVAADAAYRPFFLSFLSIGFAGGLWLPFVALWLAKSVGATPAQIGWFFSAGFAGGGLGNLVIPALADRLRRRRQVVLALALGVIPAFLALALTRSYWVALVAYALVWFTVPAFGILLASVGDLARARAAAGEPVQAGRAVAGVQLGMSVGNVLSPTLGGWIYQRTGQIGPSILVGLVPHLVMCWIVWRRIPPDAGTSRAGADSPTPGQDGQDTPRRSAQTVVVPAAAGSSAPIWLAPLLIFLVAKALFAFAQARASFEPLFAAQVLGASAAQVGFLATLLALLQLVAGPLLAPLIDRFGSGATTVLSWGLAGAQALLLSLAGDYGQMALLVSLSAASSALGQTAETVYAQDLTAHRGTTAAATGWLNAAAFVGLALGGPAAGRLVETSDYRTLFALGGSINLLAGLLMLGVLAVTSRSRARRAILPVDPVRSVEPAPAMAPLA